MALKVPKGFDWAWKAWKSGEYDEVPGKKGSNPKIDALFDNVGEGRHRDDTAWCGAFVGSSLGTNGSSMPDNPLWARNWKKVGTAVRPGEARVGDVVVLTRGDGGHVGFYVGEDADHYYLLGGNQSDSVTVQKYRKSRLLGIRRPDGPMVDSPVPDDFDPKQAAKGGGGRGAASGGGADAGSPDQGGGGKNAEKAGSRKKVYLNHRAVVQCQDCPGRLVFTPGGLPRMKQGRAPMLLETDVSRAQIVGCTQYGGGRTPCTGVASILKGPCKVMRVGKVRAILDDLEVMTNGGPPHKATVRSAAGAPLRKAAAQGWVDLTVTDDLGEPLKNERYELTLPDGSKRSGRLDDQGRLKLDGLKPGALGRIRFPDLEGDDEEAPEDPAAGPPDEAPVDEAPVDEPLGMEAPDEPPVEASSPVAPAGALGAGAFAAAVAAARKESEPDAYRVNPDVVMTAALHGFMKKLAAAYHPRTKHVLTVTSGVRTAARQASAMDFKLQRGDDLLSLYKNKAAVREVIEAFQMARKARKGASARQSAIAGVIQAQVARGVYLSSHLTSRALDIRIIDMDAKKRAVFREEAGKLARRVVEEGDHWHLEV